MTTKTEIPKGAKKPADRKPKAEDGPESLTATVAGQEYEVSAEALDDFELLDDLARLDDGDVSRAASVLRRLLGDDMKRAMDSIRDKKTGRVTIAAATDFVMDLMKELDPNS